MNSILKNSLAVTFLLALTMGIALPAFSYALSKEQMWEILDHTNPETGVRKLIVVPKSDRDLINCHLSHGDRIVPYDEELAKRIIVVQDEGANFCSQ